jgi:hypothetical protein
MKKSYFFFLLALSLFANSVFGQNYGIVIVPRATVYASEDASSKKIATLNEAELLNVDEPDRKDEWVMVKLSNGQKGYLSIKEVAFYDANTKAVDIEIDGVKYFLLSARQQIMLEEDMIWDDYICTPFLYNAATKKSHLIRAAANSYSLSPRMTELEEIKNILQYGAYDMGGFSTMTELSVDDNQLRLDWSSSGFNHETDEDEKSEETIYMSIHQTSNGEFWALHNFKEGQTFDDVKEAAYVDSKPYWLRVKSESDAMQEVTLMSLLLQDQKTNKTYYIYASPPKGHEHLFNKSYMQVEMMAGDDGYLMFTYYAGHLLIYAGGYSEETGKLETMNIYWYALKMANGKIMATENVKARKTLTF